MLGNDGDNTGERRIAKCICSVFGHSCLVRGCAEVRKREHQQLVKMFQQESESHAQDKSLIVTRNLGVFGGCGLVHSIITGHFGINIGGMMGNDGDNIREQRIAKCICSVFGHSCLVRGCAEVRKREHQELVKMFQQESESHAQVRKTVAGKLPESAAGYVLIN
ncbi:hypothetical protein C1H46_033484 [Malus baccata]|uniref:Uncharacterized protein n=1 Tax=Malus baccata TaxID=106549 RepID=A0A540L3Q7_MALBA|nr:hypothetical protein C1H46_033484 [Malus baccata]